MVEFAQAELVRQFASLTCHRRVGLKTQRWDFGSQLAPLGASGLLSAWLVGL